jgi:type IV secretory pathway VirD2 relaxase
MTPSAEPHFRFSKLLRTGARGDVFSAGAPLRIARAIDAESLKGRHEGRGRKVAGGKAKTDLSSALQSRTGSARGVRTGANLSRASFDPRQRAMVKVHYFGHGGGGAAALRAHARYVARDAAARPHELDLEPQGQSREPTQAERGEGRSVFYDAAGDGVDGGARVADWARNDRRHFRLILSAENGAHLPELRSYTREVMIRAETALGTWLDWVAVDHWDTDNPHTHIILRGRTNDGRDLVIPRDFVSHGFRNAARDVATERLGKRGRSDERLALERETRAHRPTRLDSMIEAQLDASGQIRLAKLEAPNKSPDLTNALKARAHELRRLGLATEVRPNVFQFTPGWKDGLKAMELHLDIRKSLMQQRTEDLARQLSKSMRLPPGIDR